MKKLILISACLGLWACGEEDAAIEIADQPLQGQVEGEAWTVGGAATHAFLSNEEGFWVDVLATPLMCGGGFGGGNKLIVTVPREVGEYPLGPRLNMTFAVGDNENLITFDGAIIVEEVTDTTVTASLKANFDGDNTVEGRFTAEICGEGRMEADMGTDAGTD